MRRYRPSPFRRSPMQGGYALALALLTLLFFFASMALLVGVWRADLADLDRQRADSHLVAATDSGVALGRARLISDPGFVGRLSRRVGSATVRVDVVDDEGSWRRLRVEAVWRRHRRLTLVDLAPGSSGPVVIGWLPAAVDLDS